MGNLPSLNNAILKFSRGEKQLSELLSKLKDDRNNCKLEFKRVESSPDIFEYAVYVSNVPMIDKEVGLLLGETIQSFRISLDYLAWALVEATGKKLNKKEEKKVAFPLADNISTFQKNTKLCLPDVPQDQLAIIEKYQPYQTTKVGLTMGYLQKISNTDKHRIIVPVGIAPQEIDAKLKPKGAKILEDKKEPIDGQELSNGTKLLTLFTDGIPEKWNASIGLKVVFIVPRDIVKPPPSYDLAPLDQVFEGIRQTCFSLIYEFKDA